MFEKLKALNAWRRLYSHLKQNPKDIMNTKLKPGLLTTEFWTLIATNIVMTAMTMLEYFDGELAVLLMSGLTAAHVFIRNGFKLRLGMTLRPGLSTSEFWAMALTAGLELVMGALEKVDATWATLAAAALAAVYNLARKSLKAAEINQATPKG
jgi:hypothetical protein